VGGKADWRGAFTALVTPFSGDRADWEGLERNLEFQEAGGVRGVVACGTTGESPTVHGDEKHRLFEVVADKCSGVRVAGTGGNDTAEVLEKTAVAEGMGFDACLLVDCYYNGPSSMELRIEYYGPVARAFPEMQVVPYVIPGRTGCELAVEDLAILAEGNPNVSAVKEATGNADRARKTRQLCGPAFSILSGDDDQTLAMMRDPATRASGVVSVASNVAPKAVQEMCAAANAGNWDEAQRIHAALSPLFSVITVKTVEEETLGGRQVQVPQKFRNPLPYKTLMNGLGVPAGQCRRPLGKMSRKGAELVRAAARKTWEENPWVLEPLAEFYGVDVGARIGNDANWK
jgi:4-hydroxy-tetrahydrodipicolinate synthase